VIGHIGVFRSQPLRARLKAGSADYCCLTFVSIAISRSVCACSRLLLGVGASYMKWNGPFIA
jgi:hypothetical protein